MPTRLQRRRLFAPSTWLQNGTWRGPGGGATFTNNAQISAELFTDAGVEAWTNSTTPTSWTKFVSGTSTVNQETSVINGGANAARFDVDASNSNIAIHQAIGVLQALDWVAASVYAKASITAKTFQFVDTGVSVLSLSPNTLTTSYAQYTNVFHMLGPALGVGVRRGTVGTSVSLYFDDFSAMRFPGEKLYIARRNSNATIASANATITANYPAGACMCLDSITRPRSAVIGIHDGVTTAYLLKYAAGVCTTLITNTIAYSAGALIEVRRTASTTFQLWYGGAQKGTDQTVSDASIVGNILHGGFGINATLANISVT